MSFLCGKKWHVSRCFVLQRTQSICLAMSLGSYAYVVGNCSICSFNVLFFLEYDLLLLERLFYGLNVSDIDTSDSIPQKKTGKTACNYLPVWLSVGVWRGYHLKLFGTYSVRGINVCESECDTSESSESTRR